MMLGRLGRSEGTAVNENLISWVWMRARLHSVYVSGPCPRWSAHCMVCRSGPICPRTTRDVCHSLCIPGSCGAASTLCEVLWSVYSVPEQDCVGQEVRVPNSDARIPVPLHLPSWVLQLSHSSALHQPAYWSLQAGSKRVHSPCNDFASTPPVSHPPSPLYGLTGAQNPFLLAALD